MWRSKLISLKDEELRRFVLRDGFSDKSELHLVCDASEKAYAACIYIVAIDTIGRLKSSLFVAETRVAPVKTQSLFRDWNYVQLCYVLEYFSLFLKSTAHTPVVIEETFAWTDSKMVLCWL